MRKYLYIRVSTKEQNEDRQLALKNKYGLRNSDVFIDKATGKNFDRPAYQNLKEELQKGDTLIIMSLDRLGRNKEQALEELRELKQKGVRLIVDDLPTTQIKLDEKNQLIIEMINNILIEVYTTLAELRLDKDKVLILCQLMKEEKNILERLAKKMVDQINKKILLLNKNDILRLG